MMAELWFAIASLMLVAYVVLDGFDFGAGALHLVVARTDAERRQLLSAIGPFWDGNEVWLLATGGVLFLAFPRVLASGLSGFYLAIFLVLWALILRGIAIEFRSHVENPLWRAAWDAVFSVASTILPILFGTALGNLVRGLPITEDGWFSLTLFTNFSPWGPVAILDWYTVSAGLFALLALTGHGAAFLVWKTDGPMRERSRTAAMRLYMLVATAWPLLTAATWWVNPRLFAAFQQRPLAMMSALVALAGLAALAAGLRRQRDGLAFLGSCAFLIGMLAATAACVFPTMLRSVVNEGWSLTAYNASAPAASLDRGIRWWAIGLPLAVIYFVIVFRLHRGRTSIGSGDGTY
ncbi:MAG TPA: cytochrome d ubiquinol oxidase subunit II [Vicinamibacterales bacterium]|nr:cytochrome d ubiquinol oxidase subunit II [Vicinamibacterales bacterium]